MKTRPLYKLARRLGAQIFEKTQTQKFAASEARKNKGRKFRRARTDYAVQMNEKQKARFSYGITEKQFSNYVSEAIKDQNTKKADVLFAKLETRLDNTVYRGGFAPTRRAARQMVSHGHILVGDKKITIPSHKVKVGDVITVKASSADKGFFTDIDEKTKNYTAPAWIKSDIAKKKITVEGMPKLEKQDLLFDLDAVLEFYSR
tara:strand:+ start:367 stop:975 length:609 start_codon:yes stop_codon:yes gene_type:complete